MKSVFLSNLHHAYARTDGTYAFPNSREGDMLKQAKTELESLLEGINKLRGLILKTEQNAGAFQQTALRHAFALVTGTAVGGMHFHSALAAPGNTELERLKRVLERLSDEEYWRNQTIPKVSFMVPEIVDIVSAASVPASLNQDERSCNNCRNNHTGDCDDCTPNSSHWEKNNNLPSKTCIWNVYRGEWHSQCSSSVIHKQEYAPEVCPNCGKIVEIKS